MSFHEEKIPFLEILRKRKRQNTKQMEIVSGIIYQDKKTAMYFHSHSYWETRSRLRKATDNPGAFLTQFGISTKNYSTQNQKRGVLTNW